MLIKIIGVGKIKEKFYREAIAEYQKRMSSYNKVEIVEVADEKAPETLSEKEVDQVKNAEGERILGKIKDDAFLVTLEINGKALDSIKFAKLIQDEMLDGFGRDMVFVIGGSNGLGDNVLARSNYRISFGKMTYPHQLMRVILMEQIYRAYRIINREPYHK
ncbi:23S rRNA (pseudouridine(1915)-N(3))-methyltransferase RlmH [Anaerococcus degeneri]|uniref:Ribosomal RNA large subunit methyltransferase H n=1 Tax=Anaerococcus degeneri TaxID=361500 RepID=A0ABS7YY43_9FIRM|nr:23S rRNA (pseudouridine(1915)-N(3))-methyltransferase RlmH [Anaerococcus degeneri]MBP2016165.1 23S rRNA (pseudouridine1915-N3)-methyltransferase [Anaerococcus degeneri]MCA2096632.1 23S rRNA (pseudouridine(1915)-N(3))-methyltransferase RlmH [Anaerococcus degeneri]